MVLDFVIGVGSNLAEPSEQIARGLSRLAALPELRLFALSRVYDTPALGPPQPRYLNAAARVSSTLAGSDLLERLLAIERAQGRVRDLRWGPRTLDLDVLWSEQTLTADRLTIPHPRLRERSFALAPLLDVAPELAGEYAADLAALGGAPEICGRLTFVRGGIAFSRV